MKITNSTHARTLYFFASMTLQALLGVASCSVIAQEDVIRKNLPVHMPKLPKITEVTQSPIKGLYEIRLGESDIYYTDAAGSYLIEGQLIDAKLGKNLTEERVNKLTAVDFKNLPLKDAITIKRGTGARKIAVFADPNCGYCKHFEAQLQKIDNITVHLFLLPVLGADSAEKSKSIWCSADRGKTWQDWMLNEVPLPSKPKCATEAMGRNLEFAAKHRITGTPTAFLADGTRIPGAVSSTQLEKLLADVKTNGK